MATREPKSGRYSTTPQAIIKSALLHAIDERESLVDAYHGDRNEEAVRQALRQIMDYRRMLKRRFGIDYAGTLGELRKRAGKRVPLLQAAAGKE